MSRLKVGLRGAVISELGLVQDKEYIGGRKESCDIRLQPEKGISREHFSLKFEDGKWKLKSLSRFGEIFSLGQRVEDIELEHNQTFQIPPYEFTFLEIEEAQVASNNSTDSALEISEDEKTVVGVAQQMPYIKMLSSQGEVREMLRLEFGDLWIAGRDSSCQIVIPDQRVSRRQFEIRKLNSSYTILDMDSVNGTFLNGSPVSTTDPQVLKSGDAITVLDNTMYFELHDPNFQYRMERLEVPPMQLVPEVEEIDLGEPDSDQVAPEAEYVPEAALQPLVDGEVEGDVYSAEQMQSLEIPQGGPFIGIPPNAQDLGENQFYGYEPFVSQPPVQSRWQKFKSNKVLMATVVIAFLGIAFYIGEILNQDSSPTKKTGFASGTDPFDRLTPEEQKMVKDRYSIVVQTLESADPKLHIAKENLDRIHKLLPDGYENSKIFEAQILEAELNLAEKERLEKESIDRAEAEIALRKNLEECSKIINPLVTLEQVSQCLSPSKMYNPDHPEVVALEHRASEIETERRRKNEDKIAYESRVKELDELYEAARSIHKNGYPYKAIKAYEKVVNSELPDPKKLKDQSQKYITAINDIINNKLRTNEEDAERHKNEGNLKLAIKAINEVLVFDPHNKALKDKLDQYMNLLRTQAMIIYQESIIDESFGYVNGDETRPGAKDKWRKIIEIDLEDGEYYRKAFTKLRKYGVFF